MTRRVPEIATARPPALVHAGWREAFPWLVQGTTTRGAGPEPFDLGLFSGGSPEEDVRGHWSRLKEATGMRRVVHAPQPHGRTVRRFTAGDLPTTEPSPTLVEACDGHVTDRPGVLLAVTTADCVPVFVVDPERRVVAMIHAGWRGAAAGIVEGGIHVMTSDFGSEPASLHLHLGPAICGACYEVGPEVFRAFGLDAPPEPIPIDVRALVAERAVAAGLRPERVTVSEHCTRCTGSGLFSHRGGDAHRQAGYLGIRR